MKTQGAKIYVLVFVSIAFLAIPFLSLADRTAEEKTTMDEVKQEIKDAFESMENYTADQRDEAVDKIKVALGNLDSQFEKMKNFNKFFLD